FQIDFAIATPHVIGLELDGSILAPTSTAARVAAINLLLCAPASPPGAKVIRAYAAVGAGVLRPDAGSPFSASMHAALHVPGGVYAVFGRVIGVRGDLRYIRAADAGDLWQASIGVSFHLAR